MILTERRREKVILTERKREKVILTGRKRENVILTERKREKVIVTERKRDKGKVQTNVVNHTTSILRKKVRKKIYKSLHYKNRGRDKIERAVKKEGKRYIYKDKI